MSAKCRHLFTSTRRFLRSMIFNTEQIRIKSECRHKYIGNNTLQLLTCHSSYFHYDYDLRYLQARQLDMTETVMNTWLPLISSPYDPRRRSSSL